MPAWAGDFRRGQVVQYDADGTNVSAGYDRALVGRVPISATLYVYPASEHESLEEHFGRMARDVSRFHGGVEPDFKQAVTLCGGRFPALYALFRLHEPFGGLSPQSLYSYLVIYRWNTHWIKWRVTFPAPQDLNEALTAMSHLTQTLAPPDPNAGRVSERGGHQTPASGTSLVLRHFQLAAADPECSADRRTPARVARGPPS
jgi:hypothetical protein